MSRPPLHNPIPGHRLFTDGARRPVHAEPDGPQYVLGYDGEKVYGVWLLPEEEACDVPVIIAKLSCRAGWLDRIPRKRPCAGPVNCSVSLGQKS